MAKSRTKVKPRKDQIDELLGASVRVPVKGGHAPLDFYHLLDTLKSRLKPGKGQGRPRSKGF